MRKVKLVIFVAGFRGESSCCFESTRSRWMLDDANFTFPSSSSCHPSPPPSPPGWPIERERTSSSFSSPSSFYRFTSLSLSSPFLTVLCLLLTSGIELEQFPFSSWVDLLLFWFIISTCLSSKVPEIPPHSRSSCSKLVNQKVIYYNVSSKTILSTTFGNIQNSAAPCSKRWD